MLFWRRHNKEFDGKAFSDHVHDTGRAYRNRAIELIDICRYFSAASEQSFSQDEELTRALETCDLAIQSAIRSGKKAKHETDYDFNMATRVLIDYESQFHERTQRGVQDRMEDAKKKDEKNQKKPRSSSKDDKSVDVEFHIIPSLPGKDPIIVKQRLSNSRGDSVLAEILWNFGHFEGEKCLRLAQNPHFYRDRDLPNRRTVDGGLFSSRPTQVYEGTIYVLTNNWVPESGDSRRVFFEFGEKKRVFDNFLYADRNKTIFFRDVTGILEGETLVERSIRAETKTTFRYGLVRMRPSPAQTDDPIHTADWRVPIRELLGEQLSHTYVRIGDHVMND